jgi:hypothetical protein
MTDGGYDDRSNDSLQPTLDSLKRRSDTEYLRLVMFSLQLISSLK